MITLRAVEAVREVAATGSFSAAARNLHLTQPAVSRQVSQLEREVGAKLVLRSRRGARLTPAGRLVLAHAEVIAARLARLETELDDLAGGNRVIARIGGFPSAFFDLVPWLVQALQALPGESDITLKRCGHDEAAKLVRSGELDLAFVFAGSGYEEDDEGVSFVDLSSEEMLVLLPRDHALAHEDGVALAELASDAWITGARDRPSSLTLDACRAAGFEPKVAFESDDALAIQSLVGAGLGVALGSPSLRGALRDDVVLRPIAPPAPVRDVQAVVPDPTSATSDLLLRLARG
jgi:DNA-binding transcriptional LysR family regulator